MGRVRLWYLRPNYLNKLLADDSKAQAERSRSGLKLGRIDSETQKEVDAQETKPSDRGGGRAGKEVLRNRWLEEL